MYIATVSPMGRAADIPISLVTNVSNIIVIAKIIIIYKLVALFTNIITSITLT
jgi:hypothetical protein